MATGGLSHIPTARSVERSATSGAAAQEALLLVGSPREVLARVVPGDPLGLAPLVGARLRADALLCDADAVLLCAFARCASAAATWRGRPALRPWLAARVDEALADVLEREAAWQAAGGNRAEPRSDVFGVLAPPLGLEPPRMRSACERFNRLAASVRQAFFGLVLERRPLEDLAARLGLGLAETARRACAGLQVFCSHDSSTPPQQRGECSV